MVGRMKMWAAALVAVGAVSAAQGAVITNGGFESGWLGWTQTNGDWTTSISLQGGGSLNPVEGTHYAYTEIGGQGPVGVLAQSGVAISAGNDQLKFDLDFFTDEPATVPHNNDMAQLLVVPNTGASASFVLASVDSSTFSINGPITAYNYGGFDRHTGWFASSVDLSAFAGRTVTLYFQVADGGTAGNSSGFALDDVQLVPEPASLGLLALGGLLGLRRVRR